MVLVYLLLGAGIFYVAQRVSDWARARGGRLAWYHWLGYAAVAAWTLFLVAWVGTSIAEGYPMAGGIGAIIWGGVDLVLIVLLRLWLVRTVGQAVLRQEVV